MNKVRYDAGDEYEKQQWIRTGEQKHLYDQAAVARTRNIPLDSRHLPRKGNT